MRKMGGLLIVLMLVSAVTMFQINGAHAVSTGYERYKDDKCEISLEYFPIFPYDPNYPSASEEFAMKFYIWQDHWHENLGLSHLVPDGWRINVYFRDDTTGNNDWVEWKRWYPTTVEQYGLQISWTLSGAYYLGLRATLRFPDIEKFETNYDKYDYNYGGKTYKHLSMLDVIYDSNHFWGEATAEGGGSIGIPNDLAQANKGHHPLILVEIMVFWMNWAIIPYEHYYTVNFVLGDDNPATTDCWLTVQQGHTNFLEDPYHLAVLAKDQYGNSLTTGDVYIDGELVGYTGSSFPLAEGTHSVFVNDFWEGGGTGNRYSFKYYSYDSTSYYLNPATWSIDEDTTVTAQFNKKYCAGDVNGDGIVDIYDLLFVRNIYGSRRGDPNWDSRADVFYDGKIDLDDALTVRYYFGSRYP